MSNNAVTLANKKINANSFSSTREFTCEEMDKQTHSYNIMYFTYLFIYLFLFNYAIRLLHSVA